MGLDFTLYELMDYSATEPMKKLELKEAAYFSNATAMILVNWLYRNNEPGLNDRHIEAYHYVQIYADTIEDILTNLDRVLDNEATYDDGKTDLLALHYFPVKYTVSDWINSCEMFTPDYYSRLEDLREKLGELIYGGDKYDPERCFFYNISW